MHLPGCTVPPLVDWLSGTVALASSCYGHPEPGTGPPPWSELAINHHCPSVRPAVTMSVSLFTTCSAEQWGIQKGRKGKDLIIVIMYRSNIDGRRRRSVLSHSTFDIPPLLANLTCMYCILKQGETGAPGGNPGRNGGAAQKGLLLHLV